MGRSRWRIARGLRVVALVAVLALGCNTEPCACPPAASSLVFYGRVLEASGSPIEAATVAVSLGTPSCVFQIRAAPFATASTGADGRFRTPAQLSAAGTEACARVAAFRATGEPIAIVEGTLVRFPSSDNGLDSVGFVLRAEQIPSGAR
ncbi:MAG: hypothetical protein R2909_12250 [Gemmatimonadales bacterium]